MLIYGFIASKAESYIKVIKSKNKTKRPQNSKKRKATSQEGKYSLNVKGNTKPSLLGNSGGLYNGNYGDRNSLFVNQNTLSLNIGGGTFNQSTKEKENFLSKTVGVDNYKINPQIGSMRSKSATDKIGSMKKAGPIKATISTEKVRMSKYEHLNNKYSGTMQKKSTKQVPRDKRPHSSTFIGNNNKELDMYAKMVTTNPKPKTKVSKPSSEEGKKKVNKRVRSASPGGLKNFLTHKQPSVHAGSKAKPQRVIGGQLYQPTMNGFIGYN